jgi:molybdopterin synthase sulfur carrier subunit
MKILYFAWVRQKAGVAEEDIDLPPEVKTLNDLVNWLKARGPEFEAAFADIKSVRAAIDQTHASLDAPIKDAKEIAFFPPVTGG